MLFKQREVLLCIVILLAGCLTARADDLFRDQVEPFLKNYCVRCHNKKKSEGELDLSRYTSASLLAQDFRQWEHVVTFLKTDRMPPKDAQQPTAGERTGVLTAIAKVLLEEARKLADDPGPSLPRRLSNAEYNYTIRDLTGVGIRPTASFPVDPASGEGFNNTGEALVMSPSLVQEILCGRANVADHVLLTTSGFDFAPFPVVTFTDQQKFHEQAIMRFYEQHKIDYDDVPDGGMAVPPSAGRQARNVTIPRLGGRKQAEPEILAIALGRAAGRRRRLTCST